MIAYLRALRIWLIAMGNTLCDLFYSIGNVFPIVVMVRFMFHLLLWSASKNCVISVMANIINMVTLKKKKKKNTVCCEMGLWYDIEGVWMWAILASLGLLKKSQGKSKEVGDWDYQAGTCVVEPKEMKFDATNTLL